MCIMSSQKNGTLYIGVTNGLQRRVFEHKNKLISRFTAKYALNHLVYYEVFDSILVAIDREKQLKQWNRNWKLSLIEKSNPCWKDLSEESLSAEDFLLEPGSPIKSGTTE